MGHCVGYVAHSIQIYVLTPPQVLCQWYWWCRTCRCRTLVVPPYIGCTNWCGNFVRAYSLCLWIVQANLIQAAQLLPFVLLLTYGAILPRPQTVKALTEEEVATSPIQTYAPVPTEEDDDEERLDQTLGTPHTPHSHLTIQDKWKLVKPLLLLYMLPLCKCTCCTRKLIQPDAQNISLCLSSAMVMKTRKHYANPRSSLSILLTKV